VKTPEERLRYYASRFAFVEADSPYYSLEMEPQAAAWAHNTPPGFVFDVKAFRLFTGHPTPPSMLPRDVRTALGALPEKKRNWYYADVPPELRDELWAYFDRSMRPLRESGKLGAVVLQFPPWLMPSDAARAQILDDLDHLDGYRVAVEFRNKYWLSDRRRRETLAFLREHGIALVIVDEPQGFRSSVPQVWEVTSPDLAVVRLHGRNAETWEKMGLRTASERFNYAYSERELAEFVAPLRELAARVESTHVTFNNNYEDLAQRAAEQMIGKLAA
jgi:uncharacterized protein YecE (DUF72 family)